MQKKFALAGLILIIAFNLGQAQSVDPLTGRAIVNIPLGGINAFDLGVSINLSHHGDALKVNEGPGNAGMGWNVDLGGYIYREVRGLPDELNTTKKGWLYNSNASSIQTFTPSANDDLSICTDETADWNFINARGYLQDTEPDIYHFNAPGISGKFIYGSDGQPKLIPYQDLQILPGFIIKTNTGITYTFGSSDIITREAIQYKDEVPVNHLKSEYLYYETPVDIVTTWKLTTIQSGATGATINYNYSPDELSVTSKYVTRILPNSPGVATTAVDTLYYVRDEYNTKTKLTSITLKNYTVAITWTDDLVSSIRISESETGDSKEYDFIYRSIMGSGSFTLTKPFLIKVKQRNSCIAFPDYQFSYIGVNLSDYSALYPHGQVSIPWYKGWGQDVFGYYNGQDNNKNIPTVNFYQNETGAKRFRVTPLPGITPTQTLNGVNTGSSSMDVNSNYAKLGALWIIEYPTGGVTSFTYEANKYSDALTGEELLGPGLRVSSIKMSGGEAGYGKSAIDLNTWHTITKSYAYETTDGGPTSGKILYPPVFAYTDGTSVFRSQTDLGPGSMVMYTRVKETISGQGYRVYLFDVPNMYPDTAPIVPSSKVARASGATCSVGLLKNGVYTFPYAPVQDLNFTRGYLTKLSEYSQAGVLTQEKTLTYIMPQSNNSIKGLRFEAIENGQGYQTFHYSSYLIPINQSRILSQEVIKQISDLTASDQTSITTTYSYNSKNMVIQTTQTNADNSILTNYFRYAQDYTITNPTGGDIQAAAIQKLNTSSRTGELIEQYQTVTPIGGSASVASGQLSIFKDYGTYVWPYQLKYFPSGQPFTVSSATTGATQSFVSDSDYIVDTTWDYSNGLPVNQVGSSFMASSVHYSTGTARPLANFINCKEENAVYEGFEMTSTRGLVPTVTNPAPAYPIGWTGNKSITLTPSFALITPTSLTKGENTYRISCWAYGTQAATITVQAKNGATVQSTQTMNYSTPNQWKYLETTINMTSVSSSFTVQVSTNVSVQIDDFVALPKAARVTFKTFRPLTGLTSETDDRGNSTVITYDVMGRKVNVLDRNRNVVELNEYTYQEQGAVSLKASFTSNSSKYYQGQAVTFTADPQIACFPGVSYAWTFYNAYGTESTATGASVNKTFTSSGPYTVLLTVSSPGYPNATFASEVCVYLNTTNLSLNLTVSPTNAYHQCAEPPDRRKTFTATANGLPRINSGWQFTYKWWVTNISGAWVQLLGNEPEVVSLNGHQLIYDSPNYTYQVRCELSTDMITNTVAAQCALFETFIVQNIAGVTFYPNSQCQ